MSRRLLVANRGEIAVRIIRSAHVLGWETVAIHSEADRGALWVRLAGQAEAIGGETAAESYLDIGKVIGAAKQSGATAVHPGYGLLSENADFAAAVLAAGLIFVGPDPETIALMGDKVCARDAVAVLGVPVLPASPCVTDDAALAAAEAIGWPVLVKASHGGGGRGMRVARDASALAAMVEAARREALAAFGNGDLFLEAYLPSARHVEVQLLGDPNGVFVLGDRDCSLQRRRQKLIEEAPAPFLGDALRTRLHEAARRIGESVAYRGAGTVEFLVDPATERFYFLEMNTRLQVEHGVTELVTGIDLVALQLCVASGEPTGLDRQAITATGHAIEARITAEDLAADFLPMPGRIDRLVSPGGAGVRWDAGFVEGDTIPPHYDSMFAKLLAWGEDRETARRRLLQALGELVVEGVGNSGPFAAALLNHSDFALGRFATTSVEGDWAPVMARDEAAGSVPAAAPERGRTVRLPWGDRETRVAIVAAGGAARSADVVAASPAVPAGLAAGVGQQGRDVVAPMEGSIVTLAIDRGDRVSAGQVILTMEAMKMEMAIRAARPGTVVALHVPLGAAVAKGTLLATIEPD